MFGKPSSAHAKTLAKRLKWSKNVKKLSKLRFDMPFSTETKTFWHINFIIVALTPFLCSIFCDHQRKQRLFSHFHFLTVARTHFCARFFAIINEKEAFWHVHFLTVARTHFCAGDHQQNKGFFACSLHYCRANPIFVLDFLRSSTKTKAFWHAHFIIVARTTFLCSIFCDHQRKQRLFSMFNF